MNPLGSIEVNDTTHLNIVVTKSANLDMNEKCYSIALFERAAALVMSGNEVKL